MTSHSSSVAPEDVPDLPGKRAALAVAACGLIGVVAALFAYLSPWSGVDYTGGALITVVSTILIVGASVYLALTHEVPRIVAGILDVLLLLGLALTLIAGMLLMNWWLVGAMALGIVAEAIRLAQPSPQRRGTSLKGT